jgi:hypothetical protein
MVEKFLPTCKVVMYGLNFLHICKTVMGSNPSKLYDLVTNILAKKKRIEKRLIRVEHPTSGSQATIA